MESEVNPAPALSGDSDSSDFEGFDGDSLLV